MKKIILLGFIASVLTTLLFAGIAMASDKEGHVIWNSTAPWIICSFWGVTTYIFWFMGAIITKDTFLGQPLSQDALEDRHYYRVEYCRRQFRDWLCVIEPMGQTLEIDFHPKGGSAFVHRKQDAATYETVGPYKPGIYLCRHFQEGVIQLEQVYEESVPLKTHVPAPTKPQDK